MTDNQYRDDRVHDLFAQIADDPAPPLGFTADGIADVGRRGARTRRIAAVGGATAGVAAIAVAVAALPGAVGTGRGVTSGSPKISPAATSSSSSSVAPDPVCAADVAKAVVQVAGDQGYEARKSLALQACPMLRAIGTVLDPSGKHLVEADISGLAVRPDIASTEVVTSGRMLGPVANLCYNYEGAASTKNQAMCAELSEASIEVVFSYPGEPDPSQRTGDLTLANRGPGAGTGSTSWIEKSTTTLKDGSTLTLSEVRNGDRVALKARRVLASGSALTIVAADGHDTTSAIEQPGSVYNPFPFTLEQMAAAASVKEYVPLKP
ncbi:hypothetical protein ABH935_006778 [Catenulispora sp. GAS73]|uniref:hypothetical protein n=1 Tax=Catenulispora sp. GAS73 TaxID=3156269 RepID=UPI0035142F71